MSIKLKKYLFLIPTLFVMLLNCVCYGQVIFSANAIDYNEYFKLVEDCPHTFDFTDVDTILSEMNLSKPYYFYCVKIDSSNYSKYISGQSYSLTFQFYSFSSSTPTHQSSNVLHYSAGLLESYFKYDSSSNSYSNFQGSSGSNIEFLYFLNTGTVDYDFTYGFDFSEFKDTNYCDECYYYFQYTNIPDFSLFYDYEASQSALNVDVVFNPELSGEVDRSVTLDDGSTALKTSITMVVYNHSKFDIQYKMDIFRKEDLNEHGTYAVGVYPVFTYYEKDWVYGNSLDNNADFWNKTEKQYKATSYHLVWSGRTDIVTFDYSQLPLSEGVDYTVVVRAVRNDYKFPSEIIADYLEEPDTGRFQVSQADIVLRSDFSMKQFSDIKYDRNNSNNGVLPFQGKDDKQQYENSYYAKEDDSGNVDYEGKDVYNDPDSWYNDKFNYDINHDKAYPGLVGDKESGGSSDGTFTSFASSFTNYFQFLAYIFNYFPVGIKNVFLIGFVGIMAVVLLKVVFKS